MNVCVDVISSMWWTKKCFHLIIGWFSRFFAGWFMFISIYIVVDLEIFENPRWHLFKMRKILSVFVYITVIMSITLTAKHKLWNCRKLQKLLKLDIFTNVLVIAQLILIKVPRRLKSFLSFNSTFWHHFILILTNLLYSSFQGIKIKWFEQETSNR